ncbi:Cell surface superoxide dismutase [Cu-Zn]-like protein [Emericellopsis cladophorae]|uniref:superoxide dismutase n=1 Tax=Emericellopsis cladophorae TaxID=2686198 RepID=A0A9Q0BCQ2_9HYPO|nr:Cell surface superoxide dismutase [Cu-Zn]-like protein [Emericellopsis cladophorae]KAI6781052.1 Cell surface superoxide dismutase [Cu-Zn]-like protein [Emericellopsis cladophorae]
MHGKTALAIVGAAAIGRVSAGDAPETSGNPPNVIYRATIEKPGFADADLPGELMGSIFAQAPPGGRGVVFRAEFENLPLEGGPFTYHLHKAAVPEDGNCTAALSHLDPYGAGAEVKCDASKPETCEVGDLSGKHGAIKSAPFSSEYHDLYASTKEGDEAYFGDLSFVLHYANSTRLACANFKREASSTPYPTGGHPNSTVIPTYSQTRSPTAAPTGEPTEEPTEEPTGEPTTPGSAAAQMSKWSVPAMVFGAAAVAFGL